MKPRVPCLRQEESSPDKRSTVSFNLGTEWHPLLRLHLAVQVAVKQISGVDELPLAQSQHLRPGDSCTLRISSDCVSCRVGQRGPVPQVAVTQ